ncbi:hypothetical protein EBT31_13405 [bacterium]|jgi:hypothetical protein|nr:hypothetical protein [bacterium]
MECPLECASDYALATFLGTLLAMVTIWILCGRADELRAGIRTLFQEKKTVEPYEPARLSEYAGDPEEDDD